LCSSFAALHVQQCVRAAPCCCFLQLRWHRPHSKQTR
jgi:hypothetical protein